MNSTTLEIPSYFIVSQEQFELLAIANRDLRLERSPNRELIIMPPTGRTRGKIYRLQKSREALQQPSVLTGDSILLNFSVNLDFLWL